MFQADGVAVVASQGPHMPSARPRAWHTVGTQKALALCSLMFTPDYRTTSQLPFELDGEGTHPLIHPCRETRAQRR